MSTHEITDDDLVRDMTRTVLSTAWRISPLTLAEVVAGEHPEMIPRIGALWSRLAPEVRAEMLLDGYSAIEAARVGWGSLAKRADPTEGPGPLTVEEAEEVAAEDPGLVYLVALPTFEEVEVDGACDQCREEGAQRGHFRCDPGVASRMMSEGWEIAAEQYEGDRWVATMRRAVSGGAS